MKGYQIKLPAQSDTLKDSGGKQTSAFISEDTKIAPDGSVTGTLHYIESLESFGGKGGHFFPVKVETNGENVTVEGKNGPHTSTDTDWIVEVEGQASKITFKKESETFLTLTFQKATFENKGGPVA